MKNKAQILHEASFNPRIKSYILIVVAFFITITIIGIPFLIIWFAGMGQLISKRYYENLKCRLTNGHLEFKKGVLFKMEKTIPLENIQDLMFIENPLLKYLGLRILKIETAGQSNPRGSDMKLIGIVDPVEFKQKVLNQRDELTNREDHAHNQNSGVENKTHELLKEIKDILIEIKNK